MSKDMKMKIKIEGKYKMSPEELEIHQYIQRKGGLSFKSKKDYKRKPKHVNRDRFNYK